MIPSVFSLYKDPLDLSYTLSCSDEWGDGESSSRRDSVVIVEPIDGCKAMGEKGAKWRTFNHSLSYPHNLHFLLPPITLIFFHLFPFYNRPASNGKF